MRKPTKVERGLFVMVCVMGMVAVLGGANRCEGQEYGVWEYVERTEDGEEQEYAWIQERTHRGKTVILYVACKPTFEVEVDARWYLWRHRGITFTRERAWFDRSRKLDVEFNSDGNGLIALPSSASRFVEEMAKSDTLMLTPRQGVDEYIKVPLAGYNKVKAQMSCADQLAG